VAPVYSMYAAQKPKSKLKIVMLDKKSNMSTLWRREEFLRISINEELAEKAQDIEVTIPVKDIEVTIPVCVCVCVCIFVCMCVHIWQFHVCRPMITSSIQNQILDMTKK